MDNKPRFKKTERPFGFRGYYVEVRPGEDAIRAYRKIKRDIKEDNFIDQIKNSLRETGNIQKSLVGPAPHKVVDCV